MSRVNLVIAAHDLSIDDAVRSPLITRDFVLDGIDVESFESALGRLDDRQFAAVLIASAYGYDDRVLSADVFRIATEVNEDDVLGDFLGRLGEVYFGD